MQQKLKGKDQFFIDVINEIPSNLYAAKMLNTTQAAVSSFRRTYCETKAGHYQESAENLDNFSKKFLQVCIKHGKTFVDQTVKEKSNIDVLSTTEKNNIYIDIFINNKSVKCKSGDRIEVKDGKVFLLQEF